jgi:oligoribonuclease (3'-5' exoribonuclease)
VTDWLTLTVHNSGLKQRVRKSAITVYGTDRGVVYVIRSGQIVQVRESEAELRAALEEP